MDKTSTREFNDYQNVLCICPCLREGVVRIAISSTLQQDKDINLAISEFGSILQPLTGLVDNIRKNHRR